MHPILGDTRRLLAYFAAWQITGAALALLLAGQHQTTLTAALLLTQPLALVFAASALSAHFVCRAHPFATRSTLPTLASFAGAALVAGLAWALAAKLWNALGALPLGRSELLGLDPGRSLVLVLGCSGLYLISLLVHDLLLAFEEVREAARRETESRLHAREAELAMLRMQINPHFLFNSLNSICALTQFDPEQASAMTLDLASFFRGTLSLADRDSIALGDELALIERYLAIEKRRFAERLDYELDADAAAASCPVPPLLLQPLVENAIKHGIRELAEGGRIAVSARLRDGWLHLAVTNPVAARSAPAPGDGIGLANIRRRLAALYRERARIRWRREEDRFLVEITLPCTTGAGS